MSVFPARVLWNAILPSLRSGDHAGSLSSAVGVFVRRVVLALAGSTRTRSPLPPCVLAKTIGPSRPGNVARVADAPTTSTNAAPMRAPRPQDERTARFISSSSFVTDDRDGRLAGQTTHTLTRIACP